MNKKKKIVTLAKMAELAAQHRAEGRKIVLCHGCFDLLHIGHIRYLDQARAMGDVLLVTISPDRYVDKGPNRPAFGEHLRCEALAALDNVALVAINEWPTAVETIRLLRPDIYVKGSDFKDSASDPTGKLAQEEEAIKAVGGQMRFTEDVVFSSSNLINRFLSTFPEEVQAYLSLFRKRYKEKDLLEPLERMGKLRVLVVGDTILDEYVYANVIGTSSKDPVLTLRHESFDLFAGGALAIANHLQHYAGEVRLLSVLGEADSREDFIREKLHPSVHAQFEMLPGAPTIRKQRFVEGYSFNKLFEVYHMDDTGVRGEVEERMLAALERELARCDLVLAADFGHGAISERMRRLMEDKAPFLAVNTQANAGNRGFHTISRYRRADFVSLAEPEIRLDCRDLTSPLRPLIERAALRIGSKKFAVTTGKKGSIMHEPEDFVEVPAFATRVVDRVGSGDAFLSVASLAACLGVPGELVAFLGNIVGGLAVGVIGNQKSIEKSAVQKFITSLLK
ncbi:MAG: PfkB family carbohydrate kinase [Humidesulfovibrio sp.]|uniref:PfkB family carbohydrate kinase n=1 Tax=Humidesulfovibrio sp. TaxID=2910988 RepID=UPI0027F0BA55|nr:PfkB family carbohydrate kinase [Humidesulfovibrio sp.]MDQ7834818.1 PfkB family carbohydrate kinase [Humidesulfovibrio sp.]